jgi:hypothetical protein
MEHSGGADLIAHDSETVVITFCFTNGREKANHRYKPAENTSVNRTLTET